MAREGALLRHNNVAVGLLLGRLGRCLAGETDRPRDQETDELSLGKRWVAVSLFGELRNMRRQQEKSESTAVLRQARTAHQAGATGGRLSLKAIFDSETKFQTGKRTHADSYSSPILAMLARLTRLAQFA
jgi:hypothetical protein